MLNASSSLNEKDSVNARHLRQLQARRSLCEDADHDDEEGEERGGGAGDSMRTLAAVASSFDDDRSGDYNNNSSWGDELAIVWNNDRGASKARTKKNFIESQVGVAAAKKKDDKIVTKKGSAAAAAAVVDDDESVELVHSFRKTTREELYTFLEIIKSIRPYAVQYHHGQRVSKSSLWDQVASKLRQLEVMNINGETAQGKFSKIVRQRHNIDFRMMFKSGKEEEIEEIELLYNHVVADVEEALRSSKRSAKEIEEEDKVKKAAERVRSAAALRKAEAEGKPLAGWEKMELSQAIGESDDAATTDGARTPSSSAKKAKMTPQRARQSDEQRLISCLENLVEKTEEDSLIFKEYLRFQMLLAKVELQKTGLNVDLPDLENKKKKKDDKDDEEAAGKDP